MYCGCNPTALSSQTQISRALLQLLLEKPYASVSVSELCRTAGVSRPTFYSLFSSMENVVLFTLREKACELPRADAGSSLEQLCAGYSRYIAGNRELLRLLEENHVGYLQYNSIFESLLSCRECLNTPEPLRRYAARFVAGGITGVVREYCAAEPPVSADALNEILLGLFTGRYLGA